MPLDATGVPDDLVPLGGPSAAAPTAMPQPQALPSDLMPIPKDIVPVGASAPKPPEDTGLLAAPFAGMLRGSAEVGQLPSAVAREKVEPLPEENTVAAQQVELTDLLNPKQLAEKSLYQFGRNFPALTGGVAGGVLGTMIEPGLGTAIGGGLGAGMATAAQSLGPEFARALKENPKDPDAAFNTALTRAAVSGDISGASWGLFGWAPFSGTVKNMLFQAFGVQPAVTATGTAVENVIEGKPAGQGVAESIPGAVTGTLVPMAGHAAIPYAAAAARRVFGAGAPPPAAAGAGAAGTPPPGAGPAAPGAVPPDTMPPPGTTVNVAGEADPLTVKGYRGDLVDLEAADGKPRMMTQADFAKLHTVAQPSPRPGRLPALPPSETLYGPGQPWASTGEGMIPGTPGFTMRRPGTEPAAPAPTPHTPVTLDDIDRWATEEHAAQASGENPTPAEHVTSPIEAAVEAAVAPAMEHAKAVAPEAMPEMPPVVPQAAPFVEHPINEGTGQPLGPGVPAQRMPGFERPKSPPAPVEVVPTAPQEPGITVTAPEPAPEPEPVPAPSAAFPENGPAVTQEKHTKTGADIFAVRFPQKPDIEGLGAQARKMGGYWSSFRGGGMQPGWMFKTPESAQGFADWARGEMGPVAPAEAPSTSPVAAPEPPPPGPTAPATPPRSPGWEEIGKNYIGQTIYEDQRGVRSFIENGVRHTEPVGVVPTRGGMQVSVPAPADKALEYQVAEPHPAKPEQAAEYPPPPAAAAPEPAERPEPATGDHDLAHLKTPQDMISHVMGMIARDEPTDAADLGHRFAVSESYARDIIIKSARDQMEIGRQLAEARDQTEEPTEAQKVSGNYAKGRVNFHGLNFVMENPIGSERSGIGPDGHPWSVEMPADYGYLSRTEGADGDHVDAYIGPHLASQTAFVIDQINPDTGAFDEHKVMLGFNNWPAARFTYDRAFSDDRGLDRIGNVTPMSLPQLKQWIATGDTKNPIGQLAFPLEQRQAVAPSMPQETANGLQIPVSPGHEGPGPANVHATPPERSAGPAPGGEERPSPRPAPGIAGAAPAPEPATGTGSGGAGQRPADNLPAGEQAGVPGTAGRPPRPSGGERSPTERVPAPDVQGQNYHIEPGTLAEGRTPRVKARDNLAAIELAKQLLAEGRPATRAEQAVLVKYVGWGGLSGAFPHPETGAFAKGFEDVGNRLKSLLTPDEYRTAARSTQYAHYTSEAIIRSMWDAVAQMGFKGGSVFEPGMGVGHFLGLMPPDLADQSKYHGIELDHLTAQIAKLIYPESGVRQADFTRTKMPVDTFDLAIGNPPFGDIVIKADPKYAARGFLLHDYFFAKSLDSVRPGGLMAFITSAGAMNKLDDAARRYIAERAEFVGGIRLPSSAFAKNAGTEVTADVLFFKKHPFGPVDLGDIPPTWTETVQRQLPGPKGEAVAGNVSRYFSEHPEQVLGQEGFFDKLYKGRYAVHPDPNADLESAVSEAVGRLPAAIMEPAPTPEQKAAVDFSTTERKEGSFYLAPDGSVMQYRDGAGQPVPRFGAGVQGGYTPTEINTIRQLLPIRDALRDVFRGDLLGDAAVSAEARARLNSAYDAFVAKNGPINKAEFQYRRPSVVQQEGARNEAREEARELGQFFDEGDFDPSELLSRKVKTQAVAAARSAARERAKAAGRGFNEGTFDPDAMPDIVIERRPNIDPFSDDQESYRLRAIENYNDQTGQASKRRIFTESTLTREQDPEIHSANDGILWSINKFGRLDIDQVATKLGLPRQQVVAEMGDAIMRVPGTEETYQPRDAYLSGDVVSKLAEAKAAAETNPAYLANVKALEEVQPVLLSPAEISMNLGMPWIPPQTIRDFMRHLNIGDARIAYSPELGKWMVDTRGAQYGRGQAEWSTEAMGAHELLSDVMNQIPAKVTVHDSGPPKRTYVDPVATEAAQEKMNELKAAFSNWIVADPERADALAKIYNDKFNRVVLRQWNGGYLTTPGVSSEWSWRPHQTRVIARIIQDGNTYMAHAVGAGKTSAMIGSGMEMRRLGLVNKPMYVVPNHMLGQFSKEFYEQYPTARIMVADERNFHTDRRKQFIANVAQQDLDAVIITNSAFGKVPISKEFGDGLIEEEIDKLDTAIRGLGYDPDENVRRGGGAEAITVKDLQKRKERLEQKLASVGGTQDEVNTFEEMGVDFLFVDEAHQFRKLSFVTQSPMKGITSQGSNMAWDLYTKVRYLDQNSPGRSLVMASGTPVTNTMGELYTLSRFMQPQAMAERGVSHFDSWRQAFGDTVTNTEQTAAGAYEPVTRFAKFVNMPELYKMVGAAMDIVTPSELAQYVVRPALAGGKRDLHLAPRTPYLKALQQTFSDRVKAIKERRGPPSKGDDILLSVINDGRLSAIDPRFVDPVLPTEPNSKLNQMIDNVHRIWQETKSQPFYEPGTDNEVMRGPATQMVFSNLGVNGGDGKFSGYNWMRREWTRRGIPPNQIAFIGDYGTPVLKQRLFNDVNKGKVRILVGSTAKMGTGVNAQRRLIAIHNLDPLWYPADDEQRVGRGLRQGNLNKELQIHDYSTQGTYDSTMWGMMGRKGRFIEQFFRGDPNLREMEDLGEASRYEQASAMSTADPRVMRLTEMRQDLQKLQRREMAHDSQQYAMRNEARNRAEEAQYYARGMDTLDKSIAAARDTTGNKFAMRVGDQTYTKRGDAAEALQKVMDDTFGQLAERESRPIGEIGGFPLALERTGKDHHRVSLQHTDGTRQDISFDEGAATTIRQAESEIRDMPSRRVAFEQFKTSAAERAAAARSQIGKVFADKDKIRPLEEQIAKLEAELESGLPPIEERGLKAPQVTQVGPEGEMRGEQTGPVPTVGVYGLAEEHPPGFTAAPAVPGEYRDLRADFATMPQGEPHAAARDWTLDRGRASGFEHLAAYDPAEAAVTHAYTMGMPRAVAISPELDRRLDDPNANVVLHHNHPSGNSLSRSDVQMLSRPGIAAIIAHSHDGGDTFAARPTDRTRELSLKNEGIARMLLGGMYESVGKTVKERLQGLIFKGRISPQQAERSYADLVNRAMGAAGYTHYLSTRSFDPVLAPAVAGIIHAAAAPIRRTDLSPGDFNALVNRSTDAVRPAEILAGLPGAAETNAARPGRAAGVAAGAAGTSPSRAAVLAAAGLAEDRPKDFSDHATEEAINQAMGPPGSKPPGNWFSRLQDNLGANPRTPAGTHKDFAWGQKNFTLPSTKGSTDPMSNPKWLTELAKHRDTAVFLNQYKDGLASWRGKPMEQWRRVFAALELYTLEGIDMPTDGRVIVIENRDRPLAALSKIGDIARLDNPDDIKMAIDYRNTMDQVWQNLVAETARQFGWTGTPSSRAISDAASAATSPAAEASLRRAAKIVAAIEYQHRNSYLPLMRHGDYFIRVTPKAGTLDKPGILGWTGDGYPPTTLFKLIDSRTPTERVMGGMRSGIPKTAQAEIAELQRQFPSTEYDIDHGYMFAKANQLRDLDIPAVEKLMMLVGNDARGQMADRLRHTGMSADEAKTAAQGDYDRMVDAVLDRVYEERVAGFKKPRSGVPGYDPDFGRATSDYLHWLAGYTSGLRHRPAMERADAMIAQHPDPHTRVFWRNFDRRQEDYGDELHGPLMHIRQGAFYWLLGMNAASTAKIMLHGPLLGMPTMTTGLGGMGHAQAAGDFIAAAGSILKDMRLNSTTGFTVDLTKAARTPEERALLADSEAKGITHPQGADELSAMRGRGETAMTPQQNFARRALEVWGSNISAADRLNRGALLLSSFRTANRVGMDTINRVWDRDLNWKNQPVKTPHTWAQFIVDRATGIWGDINRLPWARGQLGGMVAQFRTYVINYLSTMWQMMSRMGPEGKVSATLMLGSLGLLGGATALPLFEDALSAANWLYGLLSDIDPDLDGSMKKAFDSLEPGMGETVMHGVRPFGIDYGSIGFGDELSKNMQSPLDLFGAGISMPLTAIGRAAERYRSGQDDLSIARELAPSAIKNLIGSMYPETALASAPHGTMALAPSQLSAADQAKMGLGFRPEAMALHQEQVTQQIHRASAFKQALALGEDRIANMTARGVDTRGAIADLDRTIERGVAEGVLSKEQINEVKGALRARLMQRLHPEISSKATQRFQAAQPAP